MGVYYRIIVGCGLHAVEHCFIKSKPNHPDEFLTFQKLLNMLGTIGLAWRIDHKGGGKMTGRGIFRMAGSEKDGQQGVRS